MNKSSTWTALSNPAFRKLWIATVISGTCVAAHDSAATWMMNTFAASPLLISLMSTVASLPFFLFTLSAGVLADRVDRRKLICFINLGLAATAAGLAVLAGRTSSTHVSFWQACFSLEPGLPLTHRHGHRLYHRSSQTPSCRPLQP
jgi:MFS family permease